MSEQFEPQEGGRASPQSPEIGICGGEMTSQKTKTSLGHLPEWGDLGGRCGAAPKDCYMSIQYIILLVSLNTLLFIVTRLFLQEVLSDWTPLVKDSDDSSHPPGQKTR